MRDDEGAAFARCPHCEKRPSAGHHLRPLNLGVDGCECCGVFAKICSDIRNHITLHTTSVFVDYGMGEMLVTHLEQSPASGTEEDAGDNPGTMGCRRSRRAISSSPSSEGRGECSLPGWCLYFLAACPFSHSHFDPNLDGDCFELHRPSQCPAQFADVGNNLRRAAGHIDRVERQPSPYSCHEDHRRLCLGIRLSRRRVSGNRPLEYHRCGNVSRHAHG